MTLVWTVLGVISTAFMGCVFALLAVAVVFGMASDLVASGKTGLVGLVTVAALLVVFCAGCYLFTGKLPS